MPKRQRRLAGQTPGCKAWIGAIVDRIEVDQGTVRVMGRNDVLDRRLRTAAPSRRVFAHVYRVGAP